MNQKRSLTGYLLLLFVLLVCLGRSSPVLGGVLQPPIWKFATQPLAPADHSFVTTMVADSDLIVRGRVEKVEGYWAADGLIKSRNTIAVRYTISGDSQTQLVVRTLGGWIDAEQIGMDISHYPQLSIGEEVLLFLQETSHGYRITNGLLGKITIAHGVAKRAELQAQSTITEVISSLQQSLYKQNKPSLLPANWQEQEANAQQSNSRSLRQFNPNGTKWSGGKARYKVNINTTQLGGDNGSKQDFMNAMQAAAERWSQVESADFSFVYDGEHTSVVLGRNNVNEIFWANPADHSDDPINYNPAFLAYTKRTFTQKGTLLEVDMWINDQKTWDGIGEVFGTEFDLDSVMMHEFGHALGLGHDIDPSKPTQAEKETNGEASAVMYWIVPSGVTKRELHTNDIAGISAIYPCAEIPCNSLPTYAASLSMNDGLSGVLLYTDPNGGVAALQIPSGAVTEPITIGVRSVLPQGLLSDTVSANFSFQIDAIRGDEVIVDYPFAISTTLSVTYTNANLTGIEENSLRILCYESSSKTWQDATCGDYRRNPDTNLLTVPICHVGQFALVGQASPSATPTPNANAITKVYLPAVLR